MNLCSFRQSPWRDRAKTLSEKGAGIDILGQYIP